MVNCFIHPTFLPNARVLTVQGKTLGQAVKDFVDHGSNATYVEECIEVACTKGCYNA